MLFFYFRPQIWSDLHTRQVMVNTFMMIFHIKNSCTKNRLVWWKIVWQKKVCWKGLTIRNWSINEKCKKLNVTVTLYLNLSVNRTRTLEVRHQRVQPKNSIIGRSSKCARHHQETEWMTIYLKIAKCSFGKKIGFFFQLLSDKRRHHEQYWWHIWRNYVFCLCAFLHLQVAIDKSG